jgi:hypothetical protein
LRTIGRDTRKMIFGVGAWFVLLAGITGVAPFGPTCLALLIFTFGLRLGGTPPLVAGTALLILTPVLGAVGFPAVILDRAAVLVLLLMLMATISMAVSERQRLRS